MSTHERPLGRLQPTDDRHIQRYSLTAATMPDKPTPVVLGVNWYSSFDQPQREVRDGRVGIWIGDGNLWGNLRGGHAICLRPPWMIDTSDWWTFYDQGEEGACVAFASCRMMSMLNRTRYHAPTLYREAQKIDEWPGEDYDGTSVRAGMDVIRDTGLCRVYGMKVCDPSLDDGIHANRWARSVSEIAACLSPHDHGKTVLDRGYVEFMNSWGRDYPHFVRMPLEALKRLLLEDGEATLIVDR